MDSDTISPEGLIRILPKSETQGLTSNKSSDNLTPPYYLPLKDLRYKSENPEPDNIKAKEYSGSVLLTKCKRNAGPNSYLILRKDLTIPNFPNSNFEI
jgi:hypothetical protein